MRRCVCAALLLCAWSLSSSRTDAKIPVDRLRMVQRPAPEGTSEKLYTALAQDPSFFAGPAPARTLTDDVVVSARRANMRDSFEALYAARARLDRNLAAAVDAYVESNLREYDETAYALLSGNRDAINDDCGGGGGTGEGDTPGPLDRAVDVLKYDAAADSGGYRLFTYLHAYGTDVAGRLDSLLFYAELPRLRRAHGASAYVAMVERFERSRVTGGGGAARGDRPTTAEPERTNEGVWGEREMEEESVGRPDTATAAGDAPDAASCAGPSAGYALRVDDDAFGRDIPLQDELEKRAACDRYADGLRAAAERLDAVRGNLRRLATAFGDEWRPWTDFRKLHKEFFDLPTVLKAELFGAMTRMICVVHVTDGVGTQLDIDYWDCDDVLSEDPETSNTAFWTGQRTVDHFKRERQRAGLDSRRASSSDAGSAAAAEASTGDAVVPSRKIPLKIPYMFVWILQNFNINNLLVGYNIMVDAYVLLIGLLSDDLLRGAKHVLYAYCIMANASNAEHVARSVNHINIMNSYLFLFYRLFGQAVDGMAEKWSIDVAKNVYVQNIKSNLSLMIRLTKTSSYAGEDDGQVLTKMKAAVNKEYGKFLHKSGDQHVTVVKHNLLSKPVVYMQMFTNVFSRKN